jgi:hypothetical protein
MWTDGGGFFYVGDCRSMDRAATDAEIAAWQTARENAVPLTAPSGDFKHALFDLGWYDAVNAAAIAAGGLALILWNGASIFERNHPLVLEIATAIGKTSDDLDVLFRKTTSYRA